MVRDAGWRALASACGVLLLAAVVAGCDPGDGDQTPTSTESTQTSSEPPSSDPPSSPSSSASSDEPSSSATDPRVTAAVDDLAERLGLETDQIIVGPVEDVTWRDGAIGCPQAGQQYTQALVPGQRLILTVTGTEYAYHSKGDEDFFYCQNPVDPAPSDDATA